MLQFKAGDEVFHVGEFIYKDVDYTRRLVPVLRVVPIHGWKALGFLHNQWVIVMLESGEHPFVGSELSS